MSRDAIRKQIEDLKDGIRTTKNWIAHRRNTNREDFKTLVAYHREIKDLKRQLKEMNAA